MPYLGIFGPAFSKTIVIFEKSNLKLVNLQYFGKKKKNCINFGPKMPYLVIFGVEFENTIAIFEISTLKFVKLQNFAKKTKMPQFWTKNALFGYF